MKILGLIPARGGSKGVPRKNIKLLGGKPLIQWTSDVARVAKGLARLIVSTEDVEIAEISRTLGVEVPFMRPEFLANDSAKSVDVVVHALDFLEEEGECYDAVCLLQPTTPFRSVKLLEEALDIYNSGKFTSIISVVPTPHQYHPAWNFMEGENHTLEPALGKGKVAPRRQDLLPAYVRDGAVYVTGVDTLRAGSFLGSKLGFVLNKDPQQVNIDTLLDWEIAEENLRNHIIN